jgi:hypothetical protein
VLCKVVGCEIVVEILHKKWIVPFEQAVVETEMQFLLCVFTGSIFDSLGQIPYQIPSGPNIQGVPIPGMREVAGVPIPTYT